MFTELRLLPLWGNFLLNLFHIAGPRMIEIGVDGLSQGELQVGALENATLKRSDDPLAFIRHPTIAVLTRMVGNLAWKRHKRRATAGWFHDAHQAGQLQHRNPQISETWVWDLPPAAAIHAIDELGIARLKRHGVLRGMPRRAE